MRVARVHVALVSCVLTAGFAAPALAQTPYDGLWTVKLVTKTASWDPVAPSPVPGPD